MEWLILGNSAVYMYQCRCQKLSAGKQRQNAVFLFNCQSNGFRFVKTAFQFSFNVGDECTEPAIIHPFSWQPDAQSVAVYRACSIGWLEPQSCFQFFGSHCRQSAAKRSDHGRTWFSNYYPPTYFINATFKCSICPSAHHSGKHRAFIGRIRCNDNITGSDPISLFMERVKCHVFFTQISGKEFLRTFSYITLILPHFTRP